MRHSRGQVVDVSTLEEFDRRIARGSRSMSGWRVHDVDLRQRADVLRDCVVAGSLFLGCTFAEGVERQVRTRGGIVFPTLPGVPVDTYRAGLYTAAELYDSPDYADTFDAEAYAWSQQSGDREAALAMALHDHSVDHALAEFVGGHRIVGVMGGHALLRGSREYADAAVLGQRLGAAHTLATGGGPGAMEATNLGARLAAYSPDQLTEALTELAGVPAYRPDIGAWVRRAFDVMDRWPRATESLGIPTWHYGHEPSNPFATAIAKYFRNATREAILLEVCDAGIVFLPGAGGDGAGDLPRHLRELLRRRGLRRADGARRRCVLDRGAARLAAAAVAGPWSSHGTAHPSGRHGRRGGRPVRLTGPGCNAVPPDPSAVTRCSCC